MLNRLGQKRLAMNFIYQIKASGYSSIVIDNVRGNSTADNSLGLFDSSEKLNSIENQLDVFDSAEKSSNVEVQTDADDTENELLIIRKLKNRYYINNPILANLNINSLRYKIIDLKEILSYSEIDFLSVSETKIDDSFPDAQFQIDSYISFRHDRNQNGGGIFTLVKKGLLPNRKYEFESSVIEIISIEIVIKKRK